MLKRDDEGVVLREIMNMGESTKKTSQQEIVGGIRRQVYFLDITADEACHTVAGNVA